MNEKCQLCVGKQCAFYLGKPRRPYLRRVVFDLELRSERFQRLAVVVIVVVLVQPPRPNRRRRNRAEAVLEPAVNLVRITSRGSETVRGGV